MVKKIVIVLLGPTAVGKTETSIEIAKRFNCEIVSVDSKQIYKLMDIGTAKPPLEIRNKIPHYLIDIVFPNEVYTAGDFCIDASKIINGILERGKIPLMVGGSALYYWLFLRNPISYLPKADENLRKSLTQLGKDRLYEELSKVDPISAKRIHSNDLHRMVRALEVYYITGKPLSYWHSCKRKDKNDYKILWIGLNRERSELYDRIDKRVEKMISQGLVEEVKSLLEAGYSPDLPAMKGHGYREICDYFRGKYSLKEAINAIKKDTRHYAKRQMTWFGKWKDVEWFHPDNLKEILERVERWLNTSL
ncbi:MAG: tRNA (adenosine(37)-N6)-dimethylallyltransferase MiaA [Synergistetes bacterium]|nr:tRNA (adenosine(37)-N6)-dimethylallyltransferase MiaA [Synergistota bacterium]MCX8128234.1 tRNA (adenosine(37)-N6)-dimethylallyltransferase MiaA [Synergistota bacterium]MDW8192681.1 tRNA (adenosine(37)-N6)-dimethylallyltransferase MiaA [Synergistota bacterium]